MANEVSALLEVAGEAIDRVAISPAESLHRAIARRVFTAVGPLSAPTRVVHDGIAGAVYAGIRLSARSATALAAAAIRTANHGDLRPLSGSRRGRAAMGAINAVLGDRLAERGSDLAIEMALRSGGADAVPERHVLAAAFPDATGRLAVFLHGLGETDESWLRPSGDFGERLRADLGVSPLYVRYNTGLHISENGRQLASLLGAVARAWPVPVEDVALIGHSMGGLVARSAAHAARGSGLAWPRRLTHLVTLGTPHTGAPLEKAVHALAWALRQVPEASPVAGVLDERSAGIRDLRHGYLLDRDWAEDDERRPFDDRRSDVPLVPGCAHTFIAATVTRDPRHPLGWAVGDLLVRSDSAGGRHRRRPIPVPPERVVHLGALTHFDLLGHPAVYEQLRAALEKTG